MVTTTITMLMVEGVMKPAGVLVVVVVLSAVAMAVDQIKQSINQIITKAFLCNFMTG